MRDANREIRRHKMVVGAVLALLAALTPFSKWFVVLGIPIPATLYLIVPAAIVGFIVIRYQRETAHFIAAMPTDDAVLQKVAGRWYAVVWWSKPFPEWDWSRAKDRKSIELYALSVLGFFVIGALLFLIGRDFSVLVVFWALGTAAIIVGAVSAAMSEFVAVGMS